VSEGALPPIRWTYIPHQVPYKLGLTLQEHLVQRRADARAFLREQPSASPSGSLSSKAQEASRIASTDTLLLLQHSPVYTEGRRGGEYAQTPEEEEEVRKRFAEINADYEVTKRGGLITFHGPGQLVGYPILDLSAMDMSTRCYVDRIQQAITGLLRSPPYNLPTVPPPEDHTGVWCDESHKITSIGIQVRHRITSHGFALNVEADVLKWFGWIVACGIKGKGMTCMQREVALRVEREEVSRPDRGGGETEEARRKDLFKEAQEEGSVSPSSVGAALAGIGPGVGLVDKPVALGPEAQAVTVDSIVPPLVRHWGQIFKREMRKADEQEFKYEAAGAGSGGKLNRIIVDGQTIS
jgi:lipoate-protein ligase B